MFTVLDTFSGIGGFSLGLERTGGFKTVAFCEIEEFPRKVLKKHWPEIPIYEDIRNVTAKQLQADGIRPDIVTGGFPCQDLSVAGKQKGIDAERSGLWSELCRVIGEVRPRYAIIENVTALISGDNGRWMQRVLWDISQIGYDAEWHCIPASELGANHHRDRVWIICYPSIMQRNGSDTNRKDSKCEVSEPGDTGCKENVLSNAIDNTDRTNGGKSRKEEGLQGERWTQRYARLSCGASSKIPTNTNSERLQRREKYGIFGKGGERWNKLIAGQFCSFKDISQVEPTICRSPDGVSRKLDNYQNRLKGLGNAVVPQIPELIGRAILEVENAE